MLHFLVMIFIDWIAMVG